MVECRPFNEAAMGRELALDSDMDGGLSSVLSVLLMGLQDSWWSPPANPFADIGVDTPLLAGLLACSEGASSSHPVSSSLLLPCIWSKSPPSSPMTIVHHLQSLSSGQHYWVAGKAKTSCSAGELWMHDLNFELLVACSSFLQLERASKVCYA